MTCPHCDTPLEVHPADKARGSDYLTCPRCNNARYIKNDNKDAAILHLRVY